VLCPSNGDDTNEPVVVAAFRSCGDSIINACGHHGYWMTIGVCNVRKKSSLSSFYMVNKCTRWECRRLQHATRLKHEICAFACNWRNTFSEVIIQFGHFVPFFDFVCKPCGCTRVCASSSVNQMLSLISSESRSRWKFSRRFKNAPLPPPTGDTHLHLLRGCSTRTHAR